MYPKSLSPFNAFSHTNAIKAGQMARPFFGVEKGLFLFGNRFTFHDHVLFHDHFVPIHRG